MHIIEDMDIEDRDGVDIEDREALLERQLEIDERGDYEYTLADAALEGYLQMMPDVKRTEYSKCYQRLWEARTRLEQARAQNIPDADPEIERLEGIIRDEAGQIVFSRIDYIARKAAEYADGDKEKAVESMHEAIIVAYDAVYECEHQNYSKMMVTLRKRIDYKFDSLMADHEGVVFSVRADKEVREGTNPIGPDFIKDYIWRKEEAKATSQYLGILKNAELMRARETIQGAMSGLPSNRYEVIKLSHGLFDANQLTREEIAGLMGVTDRRIGQIEYAALRYLRHPTITRPLKAFAWALE